MVESFKPVVAALLSLPMPTIASLTCHASAAGFVLALCHDYIIMRRDRGREDRRRLGSPRFFSAGGEDEGVRGGEERVVQAAYDGETEVRAASMRMTEELAKRKWDGEVYAEIRKGLFPQLSAIVGLGLKTIATPKL
ncbi:Enoyl-CoA delta isomerase 2, peroxisomal [Hibiscus syriacus]|uniref:Enoyl-CoA delta isomerase 2, peroxisomal n=1 Tax=Hibiscus syriacus TaxID=106335 RepID=A0A6A3AIC2_HIBSY|nr:Enoyl-CoA delta isomerase 2, peroxisomal [Hibiscus syriacus]